MRASLNLFEVVLKNKNWNKNSFQDFLDDLPSYFKHILLNHSNIKLKLIYIKLFYEFIDKQVSFKRKFLDIKSAVSTTASILLR